MQSLMMDVLETTISSMKRMNKRQGLYQIFNLLSVVATAYMIWKGLGVLTNCESPIVVVLSESMSPGFERGDILFVAMTERPFKVGDIVVFKVEGKEIPIVHRILKIHVKNSGKIYVLTKGDNNAICDEPLYTKGKEWLHSEDIVGRIYGYFPFVGMITIIMTEYPKIKFAVLLTLSIVVLSTREMQ